MTYKPGPGRPPLPLSELAHTFVTVRLTTSDRETIRAAAKARGVTVAAFIRSAAIAETKK